MNDIFSKLNNLKSIEPSESWVIDAKKRVLSEAPVSEQKSILKNIIDKKANLGFNLQNLFQNLSFKKIAVPAFSLVFVLSTSIFTVGASKSSLPGEFLYSIKMINEDMVLAVAPENKKATIEMEHAGKRLEEMAEISKKTSDVEQQEKIGQLMERFEKKVNNANNHLANTSGNGEKAKVAKAINTQSKKYTEVLAKTTEELSAVVKDEIIEDVTKAINSSEKIYLTSLAAMVEGMTDEDKEEITAMVKEKVEEKEDMAEGNEENAETEESSNERDDADQDVIKTVETDGVDDVVEDNPEETVEIGENIEDTKKELLELLGNLSDDGNVLGDEDNIDIEDIEDTGESDSLDITADDTAVDSEKVILEETREEVIKIEVDGEMSEEVGL